MGLVDRHLQAYLQAVQRHVPTVVRQAGLDSLTLRVEGAQIVATAAWSRPEVGAFTHAYSFRDLFVYTGTQATRVRVPPCQFRRKLTASILEARGI